MKVLLFLCVSAALVHVSVLYDGYLKLRIPKNFPPLDSQDYIYVIVAFSTDALDNLFEALEDPNSSVLPTNNVTIFTDTNWHPPNPNIPTVRINVSSPDSAMSTVNTFVKNQTSGQIDKLVGNVSKYTVAVIVNTNNAWKVPSPGGTGWTKQLNGQYKKVENTKLGVTLIEIPRNPYTSVLLAIPYPGKEEDVGRNLTSATIEALRKSMTLQ
ncbi:serpin A3-6-like [Mantella aurantiaca]